MGAGLTEGVEATFDIGDCHRFAVNFNTGHLARAKLIGFSYNCPICSFPFECRAISQAMITASDQT